MPAMRSQEAGERLGKIVAAVLEMDSGEVAADADFYEELTVDSLEKVEISTRMEQEFRIRCDAEEMAAVNSIADALALLRRKGVVD